MNGLSGSNEKHRGYYACLMLLLAPICFLILYPLVYTGIESLPWALLMLAFVILPLLSCGTRFKGRPLFQFHYHGTPFEEEVMDLKDDVRDI